jgi:alpha-ketoglutarate-dependent taurine dioxygenase
MYPGNEGLDESRRIVENRLAQMPTRRIDWEARHVLVIDNWRVLHARGEAVRPDPDRRLKRILARAS